MDDLLAGHLINKRYGIAQDTLGRVRVACIDAGPYRLEGSTQSRPFLSIAFSMLKVLTMRFYR